MNKKAPARPKYIQVGPKLPCGMKNEPTVPPNKIKTLRPQNPFWRCERGSLEFWTPMSKMDIRKKKRVTTKQIR